MKCHCPKKKTEKWKKENWYVIGYDFMRNRYCILQCQLCGNYWETNPKDFNKYMKGESYKNPFKGMSNYVPGYPNKNKSYSTCPTCKGLGKLEVFKATIEDKTKLSDFLVCPQCRHSHETKYHEDIKARGWKLNCSNCGHEWTIKCGTIIYNIDKEI